MRRYKHNLSHERKDTCSMGEIIPLTVKEVLPADKIQHSTQLLIRLGQLLAPS